MARAPGDPETSFAGPVDQLRGCAQFIRQVRMAVDSRKGSIDPAITVLSDEAIDGFVFAELLHAGRQNDQLGIRQCHAHPVDRLVAKPGRVEFVLAALICIFEAFRNHGLPDGEEAYVMLLAPTIKQARIAFRYILKYLRQSPILSKRVVRTTKHEITLDNGVIIGCYPCTYDGVRGRTVIAVVCDELAFWSNEEDSANPADEVIAALLPAMATVRNPKLIKISTPFGRMGLLWEEFQRRAELDFPVFQLPTGQMNPTIDPKEIERARKRDPERFVREYQAEFTDSINGWVNAEILEPCIVRGRRQLPYLPGVRYATALDPASRHNDFALAILHILPSGIIVVDHVARWAGTKSAPLAFEVVLAQVRDILFSYGITSVVGDQFYFDAISQYLLKLGIVYESRTFSINTRAQIFGNLKHLMVQRKLGLLDDQYLLQQFRNLREAKASRGQIDIRPFGSGKDDLAVAVALAASELSREAPVLLLPEVADREDRKGFF